MKYCGTIRFSVALLFATSAILLFGCKQKKSASAADVQNMMTQQSENLRLVYSKNGHLSYRFETPLLERYELAQEPYMEFRKGVKVETYNDTTHTIESTLTANYAIFLEKQELWEAKGNVIATNAQGQKLETEQLFWNQKSGRIYSNVDSKVTQNDGESVIIGEGFESDDRFQEFVFRRPKGRVEVNVEPNRSSDTTSIKPKTTPADADAETDLPTIREGEAVAKPKL